MKKNDYTTVMNKGIRSATAFIRRCGGIPVKGHYSQGYHYNSGFFTTPTGNLCYWMCGDDRNTRHEGEPHGFMDMPLFRSASHLKDYTGGTNNYPRSVQEVQMFMDAIDRKAEWHKEHPECEEHEIGFVDPATGVCR